jgi:hypothetical protein
MSRRLALLLCCILLAARPALAQPERNDCLPLAGLEAAKLRHIRVMSAIPQDDVQKLTLPMIAATVQPPAGVSLGGGLVFAIVASVIVNSVVNAQVQKRVEQATLAFPPLLEQVKDFDFRRQFWRRLEASLAQDRRFKVLEITTFNGERGYVEQPETAGGEPVDAVLDLRTEYALTPDLRSFVMMTQVLLQARSDNRELYRCRYFFTTPPVADGEYEAAIAAWAAERGALYRAAAVLGMQQTMKMLRYDLTGEDAPRAAGEAAQVYESRAAPTGMMRVPVAGALVEREDGALIVRDAQGFMRSAFEGEVFAPSPETVAAASEEAAGATRGRAGPVALEDLLGVLDEAPLPAPKKEAPAQAPQESRPARAALDELDGLLEDSR